MNVERILAVRQAILDNPEKLDMGSWFDDETEEMVEHGELPNLLGRCGTSGCIAGWAIALFAKRGSRTDFETRGRYLLGLTQRQAEDLFFPAEPIMGYTLVDGVMTRSGKVVIGGWPKDLADAYDNADSDKGRARVVARRIDRFLTEHGVVVPTPRPPVVAATKRLTPTECPVRVG